VEGVGDEIGEFGLGMGGSGRIFGAGKKMSYKTSAKTSCIFVAVKRVGLGGGVDLGSVSLGRRGRRGGLEGFA
jgi:hypothetical protein